MHRDPEATLSYCIVDDRPVFLDLRRDRYFLLPSTGEALFGQILAGDVRPDDARARALARTLDLPADWAAVRRGALDRGDAVPVESDLADVPADETSWWAVCRAIVAQRSAERQLRRNPLLETIDLRRRRKRDGAAPGTENERDERRVVLAFRTSRLIRSSAQKCLAASIAMIDELARVGSFPDLVFGVALAPFAAHCWVQRGAVVLNDRAEHVRAYTPILVI